MTAMNPKMQNVNNPSDLLGGFGVDRKKMIIAAALILLMIFMWVRVILSSRVGNDASAANAETQAAIENTQQQTAEEIKIDYIELPVVSGRNDKLSRNFFDADSFSAFPLDPDGNYVPGSGSRETSDSQGQNRNIDQILQTIKIDAIIVGDKSGTGEVFIAERLLSNGSTFDVEHKGRIYEFEVMEVFELKVVLKWEDVTVTIKMSQDD